MSGAAFDHIYQGKLWRLSITEYNGERRLAIWSHYRDAESGAWKPCGGKRETPGVIIPAERQPELEAAIVAIGKTLRSKAA